MLKNKINNVGYLSLLVTIAIMFLTGCQSDEKAGKEIPKDMQSVKLSAVMENPQQYDGKQIVVKGIVTGQCASMCELFVRDGMHKATLFAEGFKFPRMEKGKPVLILANVTVGEENVVLSALGVHSEPAEKL